MKINMKQWVGDILASSGRVALPIMTHSGIEMVGETVEAAVRDGSVHARAVRALALRYPSIASSVIMDLTVEAEAFGSAVEFSRDDVPNVVDRLVCDARAIDALAIPALLSGRVGEYIKANELISSDSTKAVVAGAIGPYSLAGRLYDMSEIMMAMFIEPESIKALLSKCTRFITDYCLALKSAGANAVMIAEPAAGLLSNDSCLEFSSVYVKEIVEAVQDDYFSVFLHNCGNVGQCTDAMVYTGAAGYHFGNVIDMVSALECCPSDSLVMGNIDPVSILKLSDSQVVYDQTMQLLEVTASYPNFVLSTGCDTPPEIPFENIDAFYRALNDFNKR